MRAQLALEQSVRSVVLELFVLKLLLRFELLELWAQLAWMLFGVGDVMLEQSLSLSTPQRPLYPRCAPLGTRTQCEYCLLARTIILLYGTGTFYIFAIPVSAQWGLSLALSTACLLARYVLSELTSCALWWLQFIDEFTINVDLSLHQF